MLILPSHRYRILVEGPDQVQYLWQLDVFPQNRAWKVANSEMREGMMVKGYRVLNVKKLVEVDLEADLPISMDEFDMSVGMSGIGYAVEPSYGESYRCQICGGIVASNICTECMFDWDS